MSVGRARGTFLADEEGFTGLTSAEKRQRSTRAAAVMRILSQVGHRKHFPEERLCYEY